MKALIRRLQPFTSRFRNLFQNSGTSAAQSRGTRRKLNQTRLGVELLETRELLSGFTLDNSGNLYNTTGARSS